MRIQRTTGVAAAACALSAAVALPAGGAPAAAVFHSTLTPTTIHVGDTYKLTSSHAIPSTSYSCLEIVTKGTAYGYSLATLKQVVSSATGHLTCKQTYQAFTATVNGKTRHCPQTKADRKAHVRCGIAMSTSDQSSHTSVFFTSVRK
ncbi:MAG TPA: hypothetical protein VHE57_01815 [Mycobacteriales bacterium]|nr:hypothetical protein [Mycobacteriales bacterium]